MSKKKRSASNWFQQALRENIGLFIFGLIFASCSSLPFLLAGQTRTLSCERIETTIIHCSIKNEWFSIIRLNERRVDGLQAAELTQSCDSDGCAYGIELSTADGPISMTGSLNSGTSEQKALVVDQINDFVRNREQKTLTVVQSDVGWEILLGLILPLGGLMLLLASLVGFFRTLLGHEKKNAPTPSQSGKLTGCQTIFTIVTLLIAVGLSFAAFRYAAVSQETTCEITGTGWTGGLLFDVSQLEIDATLNDTNVSAKVYQLQDKNATFSTTESPLGQVRPCWINPWFSNRASFAPSERPAGHIFWGLIGVALVIGGLSVANAISILTNRPAPSGTHLAVRLIPDGGTIGSQTWFMALMVLALLGAIYAMFTSAQRSLPYGEAAFWVPGIFLLLLILVTGALLYFLAQSLYIIFTGSNTTLELSAHPLRPGRPAQLYLSHKSGRLPVTSIEVRLCAERTTRTQVQTSKGGSTYRYETDTFYDELIDDNQELHLNPRTLWHNYIDFNLPTSAPATSPMYTYPEIRWWFAVRVVIPKAPDFTIEFVTTVQ